MKRWLAVLLSTAWVLSAQEWKPLFNGKSLTGWKEALYKGHAGIALEDRSMVIQAGSPMNGATWTGEFPKKDYEVRFEAQRLAGNDFFASPTFPVGESYCTWVTGGWGGDIVGLSSIDGWTAADNETRNYFNFENGRWYRFRLRVTLDRIEAWIDDKSIINVQIAGRKIGLRFEEMKLSAPFVFASYLTKGAVRKVEYRTISR